MMAKYNVIDMANLYEGIPKRQMYLILSRDPQNANCSKKIMISRKRVLNINYFEDEEVKVLIWDKDVGTYKCEKVWLKDGKYRVNSIVNILFEVRNICPGDWEILVDDFPIFIDEVTLTNHVITSKGYESELIALTDIIVEDTNLLLKRVEYSAYNGGNIEDLFNKCIRGEIVNLNDFKHIVDDVEGCRHMYYVSIEFNSMIFEVNASKKTISVQILMGSQGEMNEVVSFTISIGRVGGMASFLLYKLTEIESIEDKMKYLIGRVIY